MAGRYGNAARAGEAEDGQTRVEWHECKTGVFYLQERAARKKSRGMLTDKVVVSWQGRHLNWVAGCIWRRANMG